MGRRKVVYDLEWVRNYVTIDNNGCWLGRRQDSSGYSYFTPGKYGKRTRMHSFVLGLVLGRKPVGTCHKCDNRPCCNPDHLFEGDHAANMRDMCEKGRQGRKLTPEDVLAIREDTRAASAVAAQYKVSRQTVWRIRTDKAWATFGGKDAHLYTIEKVLANG